MLPILARTLAAHSDFRGIVFVNLHAAELADPELTETVDPLRAFSDRVVFEITERVQLSDTSAINSTLKLLRSRGYRVALDDLGQGYSGLSWLVNLTPDVAKLDMSLVRGIERCSLKQELVSSLLQVCRRAETLVVAEGVETAAEATTLKRLGIDLLQGYFFGKPGPAFPHVGR